MSSSCFCLPWPTCHHVSTLLSVLQYIICIAAMTLEAAKRFSSCMACDAVATLLVGFLGATRRTFATIWAVPVLLIYPLSIVGVWGLDALGWR